MMQYFSLLVLHLCRYNFMAILQLFVWWPYSFCLFVALICTTYCIFHNLNYWSFYKWFVSRYKYMKCISVKRCKWLVFFTFKILPQLVSGPVNWTLAWQACKQRQFYPVKQILSHSLFDTNTFHWLKIIFYKLLRSTSSMFLCVKCFFLYYVVCFRICKKMLSLTLFDTNILY